jgi:hypothetical protein
MSAPSMMGQRGASARQMRIGMRDLQEIAQHVTALVAVVAQDHRSGAPVQGFDGRKPHQADRLARGDHQE